MADLLWNHWPAWCGISGRNEMEGVAGMVWNTHPFCKCQYFTSARPLFHKAWTAHPCCPASRDWAVGLVFPLKKPGQDNNLWVLRGLCLPCGMRFRFLFHRGERQEEILRTPCLEWSRARRGRTGGEYPIL